MNAILVIITVQEVDFCVIQDFFYVFLGFFFLGQCCARNP